jgi:dipeptidyl-peptidase-4
VIVPLTVNAIFSTHPAAGIPPTGFTWSPDGRRLIYIIPSADGKKPPTIRLRDLRTGSDRAILRARAQTRGSRSRPIAQIAWSPRGDAIAYLNGGDLWIAAADGERAFKLARGADDPQWSPDGARVAYVHDDDLYVAAVATRRSERVTFDGSPTRINGDPDWLYSEELGVAHAYAWSPRGDAIAYLSFDESRVRPFPIQNYAPANNTVEWQRYSLAGAANPRVSLRVVALSTMRSRALYDGAPHDEYLVSFVWLPDGSGVLDEVLDRAQQHLRLELFGRDGGSRVVWSESSPYFVDVQSAPQFLPDGRRFVYLSARDGVQALYLVDVATGKARRLTGSFPIATIERADETGIYVSVLAPARRDRALAYVALHGGPLRVITREIGWHDVTMPRRGRAYVDAFSSFSQPPVVRVRRIDSHRSETLFTTPSLARFDLGRTRALEIPSQWGPLDAELTLPHNFDPNRRYPVVVTAYGGPLPVGSALPSADRWQGLYAFLLAQDGFLVFSVDGPASNVDRVANEYRFRYSMGNIAMAGQLAGVLWLRRQPFVDGSRLGLFGWSYGGYLTAFTLTHAPEAFRSGIAGAPPADWRYYDSAYTERYMGTPQHEAAAYRATSVLPDARRLTASLLLMQGSSDDNVHLMNSIALLRAFVDAGKQVNYFLFPGARHGVTGIPAQRNLYARMLSWWEHTLLR